MTLYLNMASRAELRELQKSIRSRSGYVKNRTKYILEMRKALRSGQISDREFKGLRADFENVTEGQKIGQLEKISAAPSDQVIGSGQQAARQDLINRQTIQRTAPEPQITQAQRNRQAGAESGFYSIDQGSQALDNQTLQTIARQTALRSSVGIYGKAPLTSELRIEKPIERPEQPKPTGLKGWLIDYTRDVDKTYQEFKFRGYDKGAALVDFSGGAVRAVVTPFAYPKETAINLARSAIPLYWPEIARGVTKEATTRPFRLAGSVAGSYVLFKGAEKAAGLAKSAYTRVKSEYLFKYKSPDRGAYTKYDYYNLEGSGQRTLTGKAIPTPKPAGNINKVGFGIEKNTLKGSQNNILSTGQQKLAGDQILAFNKVSGKYFNVKVTPAKDVFVFNPKLGKYTELTPDFKLVTQNPKYPFDVVGAQNIFKPTIQRFDVSRQSSLTDYGLPKAPTVRSSPIFGPAPKSIFKASAEPLTVVSGAGGVRQIPTVSMQNLFSSSQYTYPAYSLDVSTGAAAAVAPPASQAAQYSILSLGNRISQSQDTRPALRISARSKYSLKPAQISGQDISPVYDIGEASDVIQLPKSQQSYRLAQRQQQQTQTIQEQDQIIGQIFQNPLPPAPLAPPAPRAPSLRIPDPLYGADFMIRKVAPRSRISQPKAFFPTLTANVLRQFGTTPRASVTTGLGNRLIPRKKKKGALF